ncbi:hypothetical protein [Yimella sp. NH-Cas1]|uniref:hypothetical protein n=1 Tax=Yimella sp. NH-Cas1 TaxID=2917726 RepID=UPI001EFC0861|nr:hypothetical protein [Yimella sp. NH-Cas1]MCG8655329.1 hypothetical protein [Yimella sp. NH-Cas1]
MNHGDQHPQQQAFIDGKPLSANGNGVVHPGAQALRIMAFSLCAAIVAFGIVVAVVTGQNDFQLVATLLGVVVAVLTAVAIQIAGYPEKPFPVGARPDANTVLNAYRPGMMLRFALAEGPAILALALTIALQGNILSYIPAALISLVLMFMHVLPTPAVLRRVEARFDADGARSGLSALFGH